MSDALHHAGNEATAAIVEQLIELNDKGMSEDALALGALYAGIDLISGDENRGGLPEPLYLELFAWRYRYDPKPARRDQ